MDVGSIKASVNPGTPRDTSRATSVEVEQRNAFDYGRVSTGEERASASGVADPAAGVSREQVEEAVATIQEFVQSVRRSINFAVDEGSGRVVVKVTDAGSGDVIRQIPSEEALKLAENLSEVRSLLFKAEA